MNESIQAVSLIVMLLGAMVVAGIGIKVLAAGRSALIAAALPIGDPVDQRDEDTAADDIAERHRHQVAVEAGDGDAVRHRPASRSG